MLGTVVSSADPDRAVIEHWAGTVRGPILDVGSGTGRWAGHLATLGYSIEGLEPVAELVDIARRAHPAVAFRQASIADLAETADTGDSPLWSGILAWYSLIHLRPEEMPEAATTLRRILVDGGSMLVAFFAGPRLEAFDHPGSRAYRWPVETMAEVLAGADFAITAQRTHPGGCTPVSSRPRCPGSRVEAGHPADAGGLAVRGLDQLGHLVPVHVADVQRQGQPPGRAVVGGHVEPLVPVQCHALGGIREDEKGPVEQRIGVVALDLAAVDGEHLGREPDHPAVRDLLCGVGQVEADRPQPCEKRIVGVEHDWVGHTGEDTTGNCGRTRIRPVTAPEFHSRDV